MATDSDTIQEDPEGDSTIGALDAAADRAAKPKPGRSRSGSPKGSNTVRGGTSKPVIGGGRIAEPLSPAESRRALFAINTSVASLLSSEYEVQEKDPRIETAGDALSDISKWLPLVRPAMRVVAPLTFVGSEASLMKDIIEAVPANAWQRRLLGLQQREPELEVLPGFERAS